MMQEKKKNDNIKSPQSVGLSIAHVVTANNRDDDNDDDDDATTLTRLNITP
jgi:hypothetical protein